MKLINKIYIYSINKINNKIQKSIKKIIFPYKNRITLFNNKFNKIITKKYMFKNKFKIIIIIQNLVNYNKNYNLKIRIKKKIFKFKILAIQYKISNLLNNKYSNKIMNNIIIKKHLKVTVKLLIKKPVNIKMKNNFLDIKTLIKKSLKMNIILILINKFI